jgi:SHS2 domain-containing protein
MPYRYLDDATVSDAGFEAWGASLSELFSAAWEAALGLMVADPADLSGGDRREVRCADPDLELLLFDMLGELLYLKDAEHSLYRIESLSISASDGGHELRGVVTGEPIEPGRHELGVDVKAVTLDQLAIRREADRYLARVVVDT